MFCEKCGNKTEEGIKLCLNCKSNIGGNVNNSEIDIPKVGKKKNIIDYYIATFKNGVDFGGRSTRAEYWYFFLANVIIGFALGFIEGMFGIGGEADKSILGDIYGLIVLIPNIAVGVRRMHDVNKSAWFLLIPIYNFILLLSSGTEGDNKYGSKSKV